MSSFIYFYSKFTEEFLLLGGAGIFTLLSAYCYHWVIKRRRLGAARSQVPAGVVKAYLNQLINEAQFVRTQLFGLISGDGADAAKFQNMFLKPNFEAGAAPSGADGAAAFQASPNSETTAANFSGSVPSDLLERLKALESQLAAKESLVVNINVEKTKLLEEIENLKQNQKALQNSSAMSAGQDELLKKIKNLEERLEEYSLFEDDLANLKRLQQENTSLKKRLEDGGVATTTVSGGAAEPLVATVIPGTASTVKEEPSTQPKKEAPKKASLDQNAIDSLLDGMSPIAPAAKAENPEPSIDPVAAEAAGPLVEPTPITSAKKQDDFEKLVDSVETSLNKPAAPEAKAAAPAAPATPAAPEPQAAAPAPAAAAVNTTAKAEAASPAPSVPTSEKSDEELLKEFENLLNS